MASVNKAILVGHLGRDPEVRHTPSGMAVASFTVATSSSGGRDREPQTEWHNIVVFDKQAESCEKYLAKGRQVYIEGRIQTRSWEDKQSGEKRSRVEILAHQVVFLGGGQGQGEQRQQDHGRGQGGGGRQQGQRSQGGQGGGYQNRGGQQRQEGGGGYGGRQDSYEDEQGGGNYPPMTDYGDDDSIPF